LAYAEMAHHPRPASDLPEYPSTSPHPVHLIHWPSDRRCESSIRPRRITSNGNTSAILCPKRRPDELDELGIPAVVLDFSFRPQMLQISGRAFPHRDGVVNPHEHPPRPLFVPAPALDQCYDGGGGRAPCQGLGKRTMESAARSGFVSAPVWTRGRIDSYPSGSPPANLHSPIGPGGLLCRATASPRVVDT
jgi:hypothetical protein